MIPTSRSTGFTRKAGAAPAHELLAQADGILVPGAIGYRGVEGKMAAVRYARENMVPMLGLCMGMQCAVIEFARNVCGLQDANSTEFVPDPPHAVIDLMPEQKKVLYMGGTMLGTTRAAAAACGCGTVWL